MRADRPLLPKAGVARGTARSLLLYSLIYLVLCFVVVFLLLLRFLLFACPASAAAAASPSLDLHFSLVERVHEETDKIGGGLRRAQWEQGVPPRCPSRQLLCLGQQLRERQRWWWW